MIKEEIIVNTKEEFDVQCKVLRECNYYSRSPFEAFGVFKDHKTFRIQDYAPPLDICVVDFKDRWIYRSRGILNEDGTVVVNRFDADSKTGMSEYDTPLVSWKWVENEMAILFLIEMAISELGELFTITPDFDNQTIQVEYPVKLIIKLKETILDRE